MSNINIMVGSNDGSATSPKEMRSTTISIDSVAEKNIKEVMIRIDETRSNIDD